MESSKIDTFQRSGRNSQFCGLRRLELLCVVVHVRAWEVLWRGNVICWPCIRNGETSHDVADYASPHAEQQHLQAFSSQRYWMTISSNHRPSSPHYAQRSSYAHSTGRMSSLTGTVNLTNTPVPHVFTCRIKIVRHFHLRFAAASTLIWLFCLPFSSYFLNLQ